MMTSEQKAAWLAERCGRLTASNMAIAMSFLKNGQPSTARCTLKKNLLAERLTGHNMPHYVNELMEWGIEHEDEAVDHFVMLYPKYTPRLSRFYLHPSIENFGATPDRELDDDGLIEVKCPQSSTFVDYVIGGAVPEVYKPQMCAQLACTGRKYCVFMAYDPRIKDERKRLFMRKYVPTPEEMAAVEAAAVLFLAELDEMFDRFVSAQ